MRSVLGYSVFAAGLAFGAHTYFPDVFEPRLSYDAAAPAPVFAENSRHGRIADFSPGAAFAGSATPVQTAAAHTASATSRREPGLLDYFSSRLTTADERPAAASAPAVIEDVALAPWRSAVVITAQNDGLSTTKTARPADQTDRIARARVIQRELKRVGCYGGLIDGVWGTASKRAMIEFIDRVNASLPLDEPDDFLLSLVKAHGPGTCGVACPSGQEQSGNRCVPAAIIAQNSRHQMVAATKNAPGAAPGIGGSLTATAPAQSVRVADGGMSLSDSLPPPGRMGIGAPPPADVPGGWSTVATRSGAGLPSSSQVALTDVDAATPQAGAAGQPGSGAVPAVTGSPIVMAPSPTRPRTSSSEGSSRRAHSSESHGYRTVQRLFEHPLGRL